MADLCLLCEVRPREARLQCGHLFGCAECVRPLKQCAICREPITASYNIQGTASQSDSSGGGYISSGSGTYVSKETCLNASCWREATKWFKCRACVEKKRPVHLALCTECAAQSPICPHCQEPCDEDRDRLRDSDSDCEDYVNESTQYQYSAPASGSQADHPKDRASQPLAARAPAGWACTGRLACLESPVMKAVTEICVLGNTILEIGEGIVELVDRTVLALEVGRRCVELAQQQHTDRKCVCVLLAPTVPMVRQRFEVAKEFEALGIRTEFVIGTADVDKWLESNWQGKVNEIDILITTPQLFLDTLNAGHLKMTDFCALIVEECQHCSGRHPYARIFQEHYAHLQSPEIRVLGLSGCLVKQKLKTTEEKQRAKKQMERLMQCEVVDINKLVSQSSSKQDLVGTPNTAANGAEDEHESGENGEATEKDEAESALVTEKAEVSGVAEPQ